MSKPQAERPGAATRPGPRLHKQRDQKPSRRSADASPSPLKPLTPARQAASGPVAASWRVFTLSSMTARDVVTCVVVVALLLLFAATGPVAAVASFARRIARGRALPVPLP
jgi:hypothetical protein